MAKGRKTGGRKAGVPNRRSADVEAKLAALGCDPIEGMARIAIDETQDIGLRAQMLKELAQYVAPKRKSVEMTGAGPLGSWLEEAVNASYRPSELVPQRARQQHGHTNSTSVSATKPEDRQSGADGKCISSDQETLGSVRVRPEDLEEAGSSLLQSF